jgi:hypothetical protein
MLINILLFVSVIVIAIIFGGYVASSAWRKYVGHNPSAPSIWSQIRAWWPGFVKRHIVDWGPYDDESHASARYRDDEI